MRGSENRENEHMLLLAQNDIGYNNLIQICTIGNTEGFYYKPRIDWETLERHNDGLIVTTGCIASPIASEFRNGEKEADYLFKKLYDIFGKDRFFIELQHHNGINDYPLVAYNKWLLYQGQKYNIPVIITNDSHYARPEDAYTHDVLLCVQTNSRIDATKRFRFSDDGYYIKSSQEMYDLMIGYVSYDKAREILHNTVLVAEMCNVDPERDKKPHIPQFAASEIHDTNLDYLVDLVDEGMERIYGKDWRSNTELRKRCNDEIEVIKKTGFANYFLMIYDICQFAKQKSIIWNTRGSAAGSIVNYAIGVSFIDPVENKLLFSRFLNTYRVSIPDCDLDFPDNRRKEVVQYIIDKYGQDYVAQVITFGHMKARMSIRDVGRAMGLPAKEVDIVAKSIKNTPGKPITIEASIDPDSEYFSEAFYEHYTGDKYYELISVSHDLENTIRNSGIHAAAILIGDKPLINYLPLKFGKNTITKYTSCFDYPTAESLGIVKVDCLGLATLTIIEVACKLINERHNKSYTYYNIPYKDSSVFELLGDGNVIGVFQVENPGLSRVLTRMKPTRFSQVADVISLYRPGPIGYIPQYLDRMQGKEKVSYDHQLLEDILSPTYGIAVYQEQIVRILCKLGGFSEGEADKIRKAISKKDRKVIDENRPKFIKGCIKNGIGELIANKLYDDIQPFALYSFNLAHAAAYARITLITAYLKANYRIEYLCACLMVEGHDQDKRVKYIYDCLKNDIQVLPPEYGKSGVGFQIEEKALRYGYSNIRGIGIDVAEVLNRMGSGDIRSLYGIVNHRIIENLVFSGSLDNVFAVNRRVLCNNIQTILDYIKNGSQAASGQYQICEPDLIFNLDKDEVDLFAAENQSLGTWITKHPIDSVVSEVLAMARDTTTTINESEDDYECSLIAVILESEETTTKAGAPMWIIKLCDQYGIINGAVFDSKIPTIRFPKHGEIVLVKGWVTHRDDVPFIFINELKYYKTKKK
jgi:DNA polymerase-3 subunit alpha